MHHLAEREIRCPAPMALQAAELGLTGLKVYGRGTVVTPEFLPVENFSHQVGGELN